MQLTKTAHYARLEMNPTTTFRFRSALVQDQWKERVSISVRDGIITAIESDGDCSVDQEFDLVALPGMINLHSHAFQRGFAGLSEYRTAERDSFWTWRQMMYQFVMQLTPDHAYIVARQLYLEMLAAGYTWVGEFHYLHNDANGKSFSNLGEMSDAIIRAAHDVGIGLCHLPVLYQRGGFLDEPLSEGQRRFELSTNQFLDLVGKLTSASANDPNVTIGMALHSLRAVDIKTSSEIISHLRNQNSAIPIHIHVAEQVKEVADCESVHNMRPVEYLYNHLDVDKHWCLIHATHLVDSEVRSIARSGAVVGLCPTTEANLGDGFFPAKEFLAMKGLIGIGSDSHCAVDFRDELRTLEYGQRLQRKSRAVLGSQTESVGRNLYRKCARGGAQAIGIDSGSIAIGSRADFTFVDPAHPAIALAQKDRLLDRVIFTHTGNPIAGVSVGGNITLTKSDRFQTMFLESTRQFNQVCRSLSESSPS